MTKKEILEKLKEIPTSKDNYMVIGRTSLVCHGLLRKSEKISIACKPSIGKMLPDNLKDWLEIKIEEGNEETDEINEYHFRTIENCLKELIEESKKENKSLIKKVELYLSSKDNYQFERKRRLEGYTLIGGVDEVGRGPLVGPVVAACCILPEHFHLEGLTDSKKLSEKKREYFYDEIKKQAITYGIGIIDEERIDEINIYEATKEAMIMAISITISAASVLAKVTRDRMMVELDKKYPMYDFKKNVGYPTKNHLEAIEKYGIIKEHRKSYGPVRDYLEKHPIK